MTGIERLNRELPCVGRILLKEIRDAAYEASSNLMFGDGYPGMKCFLPADLFADDGVDSAEIARRRFPTLFHRTADSSAPLPFVPPVAMWLEWLNPMLLRRCRQRFLLRRGDGARLTPYCRSRDRVSSVAICFLAFLTPNSP
jgi:hypothetical protein